MGKAFAALIDDGEKSSLRDKVLLFRNTYNSLDFSKAIATIDYHPLPRCSIAISRKKFSRLSVSSISVERRSGK
jgi:hypothetical protein